MTSPSESIWERARAELGPWLPVLVYTGLTLAVFWYVWIPIEEHQRTWRWDPIHQYWGDLIFQVETLGRGQLALWNPYDRGGAPVYGDPQPGLLYPPTWILVAIGFLAGGVEHTLMEAKVIGHWIFGALGMHLFARRRGCPEAACYLGGALFAFTSPAIRYGGNALNWTYAWIPWVLLATDYFCEKPSWRRAVVLGTTVAMALLSGAPAVFLYTLLVAVPLGLTLLRGQFRRALPQVLLAAGVAALWLAPLVLANLEQLPHTVREERDLSFVTWSAFEWKHLVNPLVPRLGGENIFFGLVPLAAIAAAAAMPGGGRVRVLAACGLGGLLLGMGWHLDVLGSLASWASPFSLFRAAHRYLYVTTAAFAAAAALGVGALYLLEDRRRRAELGRAFLRVGGAIAAALAIGWIVARVTGESDASKSLGLAALSAAVGTGLLFGLVALDGRARAAALWAAFAIVSVDLWYANADLHDPGLSEKPVPTRDHLVERLDGVLEGDYRVFDREFLEFRPGVRLGIRDFSGYEDDPLGLTRYARYRERVMRSPSLLGHANIRYYLKGEHPWQNLDPPRRARVEEIDDGVYEVLDVAPAVLYVPDPVEVDDPDDAISVLSRLRPGEGAVVEGEVSRGPKDAEPVAGRFLHYEPNRLVAEIETPAAGAVIIAEAYYPQWRATVNGEAADIVPANGMFRAVSVPGPGKHRIEMEIRSTRYLAAMPAYGAAWLALFAALCPRPRRRPTARPVDGERPEGDGPDS